MNAVSNLIIKKMENNNEKKLYTLLVYSENIAGILNQIPPCLPADR